VTQQQLNLVAVVGLAVCWGAFALTWIAGAIYNQSRGPAAELPAYCRRINDSGHQVADGW